MLLLLRLTLLLWVKLLPRLTITLLLSVLKQFLEAITQLVLVLILNQLLTVALLSAYCLKQMAKAHLPVVHLLKL